MALSLIEVASGWRWNIFTYAIKEEIRLVFRILLLGITAAHHGVAISTSAAAIACKQEKDFLRIFLRNCCKKKKFFFLFLSRKRIECRCVMSKDKGIKCIKKGGEKNTKVLNVISKKKKKKKIIADDFKRISAISRKLEWINRIWVKFVFLLIRISV